MRKNKWREKTRRDEAIMKINTSQIMAIGRIRGFVCWNHLHSVILQNWLTQPSDKHQTYVNRALWVCDLYEKYASVDVSNDTTTMTT